MRTRRLSAALLSLALATALSACGSTETEKAGSAPSSSVMTGTKETMTDKPTSDDKMTGDSMSDKTPSGDAMSDDNMIEKTAAGRYLNYSDYAANPAQYAETNVVYFFHAPWCPTCKATEEDAQAKKANLPAGLTLVKVD
ncbi:MAG: thioredoxin family protein, partial [Angustibacter sp.]